MSCAKFLLFVSKIDIEFAEQSRSNGCPYCGGTLHFARYTRTNKDVNVEQLENLNKFHSLCCSAEGCRKRVRPLSIRYAGRSPFSVALFLFAELLRSGGSDRRVNALYKELNISKRTLRRWLVLWNNVYSKSVWWRKIASIWMLSGKTLKELWALLIKTQKTLQNAFEYLLINSAKIWNENILFGINKIPAKDVRESNCVSII